MDTVSVCTSSTKRGTDIIVKAEALGLNPKILYGAVIDLSSEGLFTANCINMAAGILLEDLGLPKYFFEHITSTSLASLLQAIATSMKVVDGRVILSGSVSQVDFNTTYSKVSQQVRIATKETRDSMESVLQEILPGRRRDYYYCPASGYYTYIIRPETVQDFSPDSFEKSRFLFTMDADFSATPEPTRRRYEEVLKRCEKSTVPVIEVFDLPETGETRLMFKSDFVSPQLPVLRKILEDHGLVLSRAYWEAYVSKASVPSSICTLYVLGELTRIQGEKLVADLCSFLSFAVNPIEELYLSDEISFHEMLFAGNCIDFSRLFLYRESENAADREIIENLTSKDQREAFAKRIQGSNKSTYGTSIIRETVAKHPDLIKFLYSCFEQKFAPGLKQKITEQELELKWQEFDKLITSRFIDFPVGYDILAFMFKIVTCTLKTNFYKPQKRSFSFRFDNRILDPLVFSRFVYGIFYVNGHYGSGTHLRAADIARGGLRLIRVSYANYEAELDNAVLLNYALGPQAQRLKHKDICESGAKGVILPRPQYADQRTEALSDFTEGVMDLVMPDQSVADYYGKQEIIFFGPDEGTAPFMDDIAYLAQKRGYPYWRTLTTGKSFGIPHDTYGLLTTGELFGLYSNGEQGVDLQIDGRSVVATDNMDTVYKEIGEKIEISGMTTCSIMSAFRTLIAHYNEKEEELNLMITGGPDGDLGANQIQCYKGKICLIIDGGSILFDPEGLDKKELRKLAFMRHSSPRVNSLGFPIEKLSSKGFRVPIGSRGIALPDGTIVEDGTLFHRTFLANEANRQFIREANIRAFIPCGGFKDTINHHNVKSFIHNFSELQFVVEGANVFFDDSSRRYIAASTPVKQIKDTTANKGGVFSSSIAEVLTGFLLGEDYEGKLLNDSSTRWSLTRDVLSMVNRYSCMETNLLLRLHDSNLSIPLFELSESSSEEIFRLQNRLEKSIEEILSDSSLVWEVFEQYIPNILREKLGKSTIFSLFGKENLQSYRNAIITKKLSSMAYYRFGERWGEFLREIDEELLPALHKIFAS